MNLRGPAFPVQYRLGIAHPPAPWYREDPAMSLVQLESFVAVAEEGHVGRAARRLHVSQPPLTRRIQSLEAELGVELFERTPRGMRLRPAGQQLLARVREILSRVDDLQGLCRTLSHERAAGIGSRRAAGRRPGGEDC
jgi:DNA-binding transcriptional LysR family regulator